MSCGESRTLGHKYTVGDQPKAKLREYCGQIEAYVGLRFGTEPILLDEWQPIQTLNKKREIERCAVHEEAGSSHPLGKTVPIEIVEKKKVPPDLRIPSTHYFKAEIRPAGDTQNIDRIAEWVTNREEASNPDRERQIELMKAASEGHTS